MSRYDINDFNIDSLGCFYHPKQTLFSVFAPDYEQMDLILAGQRIRMDRKGLCFEVTLEGDLECSRYHYETREGICFCDPFAYLSLNGESYVLDENKFIDTIIPVEKPKVTVLYECSVRDFSSDSSYPGVYRGKFLSFTETGLKTPGGVSAGLDYLKELGISHLQLLPVFDFDLDKSHYNWGYNPRAYNYVSPDYVSDRNDPYAYVNELRRTINALHSAGIRVNLDVVFNHVYRYREFDLGKMLKGRCYRRREDGRLAEGTFCGNEIASEDVFMRAYILKMVERYLKLFDIDGIRMDLMGISDIDTVNLIREKMNEQKEGFMVYGEGWNMGDVLSEKRRASIPNAGKMPGVAMFNDHYRETLIHYISGNNMIGEDVRRSISTDTSYLDATQSINYVECHDDYTFFDRMLIYKGEDSPDVNHRRCLMAMAIILCSKGIPFIHMGEEFFRTKKGVRNSYNAGDLINKIDWKRRERFDAGSRYLKDLIGIRNRYPELDNPHISISFEEEEDVLICRTGRLTVYINPGDKDVAFKDEKLHRIIFDGEKAVSEVHSAIAVSAYSVVISSNE